MAGFDGTIRIDSRIDKTNARKDLAGLESDLKSAFADMRDIMQGPVAALGMIKDGIAALWRGSVGSAAAFEDMVAAFTPLTGSVQNAKAVVAAFNKEAASTPFTLQQIGDVGKQLLPVLGNDISKLTSTFRMLGDTAGGNAQKLDSITRGYVKTLNQGKVSLEALNMISDAGVPIQNQLAASMGLSVSALFDMVSAGNVSSDELTKAFQKMTAEGGIFFGGMSVASQTYNGLLSTLEDNMSQAGAAIGNVLLPVIKEVVTWAADVLQGFTEWATTNDNLKTTLTVLAYALTSAAIAAGGLWLVMGGGAAIAAAVQGALAAMTGGVWRLTAAIAANPIGAIATVITAVLIPALIYLYNNWEEVRASIVYGFEVCKKAVVNFALTVAQFLVHCAIDPFIALLYLMAKIPGVGDKFREALDGVTEFRDGINNTLESMKITGEVSRKNTAQVKKDSKEQADAHKQTAAAASAEADALKKINDELVKSRTAAGLSDSSDIQYMKDEISAITASKDATIKAYAEKKISAESFAAKMKELRAAEKLFADGLVDMEASQSFNDLESSIRAIDRAVGDGMISEDAAARKRAELVRQQIEEYSKLGYSVEAFENGSTRAGDVAIAGLQKTLADTNRSAGEWLLVGIGIPENIADGIGEGVHFVTGAVKDLAANVFNAFENVFGLLASSVDFMGLLVDFDPASLLTDFTDFITGLSDFFMSDLGGLPVWFDSAAAVLTSFLSGMISNLPAIIETIGNVISHILTYIAANGPQIIAQVVSIVSQLVIVLAQNAPAMFDALLSSFVSLIQELGNNAGGITSALIGALIGIFNSFVSQAPALVQALIALAVNVFDALVDNLPEIFKTLIRAINPLLKVIIQAFGPLVSGIIEALPGVIDAIIEALPDLFATFVECGPMIAVEIIKSLPSMWYSVIVAFSRIITSSIPKLFVSFYEIGKYIIQGISKGFTDYLPKMWSKIWDGLTWFITKVLEFFGIHSPSTVFADIGVNIVLGLVEGITSIISNVLSVFVAGFDAVFEFLSGIVEKFVSFGGSVVSSLISGIDNAADGIGSALWDALSGALDFVGGLGEAFLNFGKNLAESIVNGIKSGLSSLGDLLSGGDDGWFGNGGGDWYDPGDWFAKGTHDAPGGMAVVGEDGPELIELPQHSRVYTADETKAMLSGSRSIMSGLSSGLDVSGLSPAPTSTNMQAINLSVTMTGTTEIDGKAVARTVFRHIDKVTKAAYGY